MTTDDTDALTEHLWEAVAEVRDQHPRVFNDAPTDDVVAAVLPIIAAEVRKAKAEVLRAWASGVESQLDATASEGIALGEWGRGLRSGIQQARDTADHIEAGDSDEHR